MSELINTNDNRATIRWKLLTGASALALTAYVASAGAAQAEDGGRPVVWLEMGGQMEMLPGLFSPFTAPFTQITPTPDAYTGESPTSAQHPPHYALGLDGKITFQPEDSKWSFSAGIRYGRSHRNKHVHHQTHVPTTIATFCYYSVCYTTDNQHHYNKVADTKAHFKQNHFILDFQAGRDVGLGILGRNGTSTIGAGVRIAQFSEKSTVSIYARPIVHTNFPTPFHFHTLQTFDQYFLHAQAERSFKGIGPTLSWNASAIIAGNPQDGELAIDWDINGAVLFGKQKARTAHLASGYHVQRFDQHTALPSYGPYQSTRSRSVTVPNVGASVGLSVKYPNVKVSIGYRYDTFLKAMDTGIDTAKNSNLTFSGPYASISIGLGD